MIAFSFSILREFSLSKWLVLSLAIPWTLSQCVLAEEDGIAFFESRIRPALVKHCFECHSVSAAEINGGLRLDSREGISNGGDSGPVINLKDADKSLLMKAIRHQDLKMPPKSKLPDAVIADFEKWIAMGAPDPRNESAVKPKNDPIDWHHAKQFWSFRQRKPIRIPAVPSVWSRTPIDSFVDEKRSRAGLQPMAESSR
ncbi:MAG TPA: c-type cytochrome domain-containing protein, partial [Pirellula sp.]|nr:c-type cytochrome domain-containing protein [Pirellula sp.]